MTKPPLFFDCPPFLAELRRSELGDKVPDLELLEGDPDAGRLPELLAGRQIVMNDHTNLDRALLSQCPDLKAIVFLGTGPASFIDLEAAADLGIRVRSYKGYGDRSVAEHTLALMFAAGRQIASMDRATRAGSFEPKDGLEFLGKTLGLIGTGGIGSEVARMASAIGMKVFAWNRSGVDPALPAAAVELDDLLSTADVVSLHLVLNDETAGFLSAERLAKLKPGVILVNTARGALVDEAALIEALKAGRIGHAALDVFADEPLAPGHPLLAIENVTLTPHAGFMTREASIRLVSMALDLVEEEMAKLA